MKVLEISLEYSNELTFSNISDTVVRFPKRKLID
jgi:hypothetical protein